MDAPVPGIMKCRVAKRLFDQPLPPSALGTATMADWVEWRKSAPDTPLPIYLDQIIRTALRTGCSSHRSAV